MNIVLFGLPGSGKGTQSDFISKEYSIHKVSTGDLLREQSKTKSELGIKIKSRIDKGLLVSDDIIDKLITKIISNKLYFNRLIFDGYPRTLSQAKNLDFLFNQTNQKIDFVFMLKTDENNIIKRILGRLTCTKCGLIFNKFFNIPTVENHKCGSKYLKKREDDNEEVLRKRFKTYNEQTAPILNYYKQQDLLVEIDGMLKIDQIHSKICGIIDPLKP